MNVSPPVTAPAGPVLTGELFREVNSSESAYGLVAVGLALHHFAELVDEHVAIDPIELHRATTILTRQVSLLLAADAPLEEIGALMLDPQRVATVDGRSVAELCGDRWPVVRALADERVAAAIEGERTFGATTVLHLAATRAVRPRCVWWGTDGWAKRVADWLVLHPDAAELRAALDETPEVLADDVLGALIDA